jgi:aspartyl aminopeptidase
VTDSVLEDLLAFLGESPTPFHCVASAVGRLEAAGFQAIAETDSWADLAPGRYTFVHGGSTLFAFVVPEGKRVCGFRIVGAHTDSPNLRLKPNAEYKKEGYAQLGVEVYGGVLLNSWLDRDLSLAGRAFVRQGDRVEARLVRFTRPMARVAQLAIHLDRDVNDGLKLNRQEHLAPIFGLASEGAKDLTELLAENLKVSRDAIVGTELMLYDVVPPTLGGRDNELVFSGRLDNQAMCHAGLRALIDAAPRVSSGEIVPVLVLFDHEEVGSESAYGAHSGFLPRALERIVIGAKRGSREDYHRALAGSICVSADMAHAVHPNYESRHETRHKPVLNGGPVIKVNAQQRYATSAATAVFFRDLCARAEVPVQHYAHRTDMPCGSTIGPIASTLLGIRTVDVGNPMLSMHSIRELGGAKDPAMMTKVLGAFYTSRDPSI